MQPDGSRGEFRIEDDFYPEQLPQLLIDGLAVSAQVEILFRAKRLELRKALDSPVRLRERLVLHLVHLLQSLRDDGVAGIDKQRLGQFLRSHIGVPSQGIALGGIYMVLNELGTHGSDALDEGC